jgi:hypothetical protein
MSSLDLTAGRAGAAPLWLLPDGSLSTNPEAAPAGVAARDALVTAARWISSRRTSTFAQLFPPGEAKGSATPPPRRTERLSVAQAGALLTQLRGAIAAAAVGSDEARRDAIAAAQLRSAALTVLSHLLATVTADRGFRGPSDDAAAEIFKLIDAEQGEAARAQLRAHAILLLQLRGVALSPADRTRAGALVRSLSRAAPPYAELKGPWRFAMCSDIDFHEGECEVLVDTHGFHKIDVPAGAPSLKGRWGTAFTYVAFEAPFKTPEGEPIQILARAAHPEDENLEMGEPFFAGVFINRHAQLGSFDLKASTVQVKQRGYKLMLNSQCAGLTTRFAITRMFPDADVYSSWDSTYFRTEHGGETGKIVASEGQDCFVAILQGMNKSETFAQIDARVREAQWSHPQTSAVPDYVQFVGPAHPLVLSRFNDVDQDGRSDAYDGFLDFYLKEIAEDIRSSITPRDPGVPASAVGGEAAKGLEWAAGSMDRVTQYSDLWAGLPGSSELLYAFQAGGFYSHREPPQDVPGGKSSGDPGRLPAVCRFGKVADKAQRFQAEVMFHAWLGHSGKELKRLMVAADAVWRAFDLGYLAATDTLATPLGQRGMLLLTLAGLLDFPADQNFLDGLWSMAMKALRLPEISRSAVHACITEQDHDANNYYGGKRSLEQLGAWLTKSEPLLLQKLSDPSPEIGRAAPLDLP